MAGRPKIYQEEELITRATQVFWEKGYHASSAQDLMKAMGIGQGSFYRTFPKGKKQLYQKTLVLVLKNTIKDFYAGLGASTNPIDFINQFFYGVAERSNDARSKGCYLGNAIVELSNLDKETQELAKELLNKLKDGFQKALLSAQQRGLLSKDKSPKLLASHLINFWNGINVSMRTDLEKEEIMELIKLNLRPIN